MTAGMTLELLTVGRVSVDLYADAAGAGFGDDQRFVKSIGGTATNVAVAAARLGRRSRGVHAGRCRPVRRVRASASCSRFGVDTTFVGRDDALRTPLAFAALTPPEDPSCCSTACPKAPDMQLAARGRRRTRRRATSPCSGSPARRWRRNRPAPRSPSCSCRAPAVRTPCSTSTTGRCCGRARGGVRRPSAAPSTRRPSPSATGPSARSPSARTIRDEAAGGCSPGASTSPSSSWVATACSWRRLKGGRRAAATGRGRLRPRCR